jgi:hypothetical protein
MDWRPALAVLAAALALAGCASPLGRQWVRGGFDDACRAEPRFAAAAEANRASLDTLVWSPWGAPETGWRTYAPQVAAEAKTPCAPDTGRFAARLARWQVAHGLPGHGAMTPETFDALKAGWQARRPFLAVRAQGICPDPPAAAELDQAARTETLDDRPILLTRPALAAYRRMRAAAVADLGPQDADALKLFSGYRSPAYDDERCAREQNCQGVVRAQCSAHRTGTALDLMVGHAPGLMVDSSAAENRLHQTGTPAYRWLVVHARRYGFANYVFEPWHWEWTGGR